MHEIHLAQSIASQAASRARELGLETVGSVRIRLGKWTCIDPDPLANAFEQASREAGMAGVKLEVELIEPECKCEDCGATFPPESTSLRCPNCGSARVVLQQGRDMELVDVTP